jgi:hypothetical protein
MIDIFLYAGEDSPTDIILSDPTEARDSEPVVIVVPPIDLGESRKRRGGGGVAEKSRYRPRQLEPSVEERLLEMRIAERLAELELREEEEELVLIVATAFIALNLWET